MNRKEFIYQYLLIYNDYEKKFNRIDAVSFWKQSDNDNATSGMIFMVLRNALVHNTLETLSQIEKTYRFTDVIDMLKECKLESKDRIKYMDIILKNEKVTNDLEDKGFKLINTSRNDIFKLFQKKESEFYSSIFFSHKNLLFDTTVSTYNHQNNCKEYLDGYYIESELHKEEYILKFFKNDDSTIIHNINIFVDKDYKINTFYKCINLVEITIVSKQPEHNVEKKISVEDIEKLQIYEIKALLSTYIFEPTIKKAAEKIKNSYNNLNNFLHIIGVQNSL